MRDRRVEVARVERPGARVEQLAVGTYAGGVGDDRHVAQARRRPRRRAAGERGAPRPVQREARVEERDLRRTPPATGRQQGGELAAHPDRREMLDRDEREARVGEVVVDYGRNPTLKLADVQ